MMDEQHSHVKTPLQLAERAKHGRDLGRRILIDAGDAHERVENEKARTVLIEGGFEAPEMFRVLESQRIDIEPIERDPLHGETLTLRDVATDRVSEKAVELRETEPGIGEGALLARVKLAPALADGSFPRAAT